MHSHSIEQWTHDHAFLGEKHEENERRTWLVVVLTLVMMVGEIVAGSLFGSMALLADGWHSRLCLPLRAAASRQCALHLRHRQVRRSRRLLQRDHPRPDRGRDRL